MEIILAFLVGVIIGFILLAIAVRINDDEWP